LQALTSFTHRVDLKDREQPGLIVRQVEGPTNSYRSPSFRWRQSLDDRARHGVRAAKMRFLHAQGPGHDIDSDFRVQGHAHRNGPELSLSVHGRGRVRSPRRMLEDDRRMSKMRPTEPDRPGRCRASAGTSDVRPRRVPAAPAAGKRPADARLRLRLAAAGSTGPVPVRRGHPRLGDDRASLVG
jgi:hypothetical protein